MTVLSRAALSTLSGAVEIPARPPALTTGIVHFCAGPNRLGEGPKGEHANAEDVFG